MSRAPHRRATPDGGPDQGVALVTVLLIFLGLLALVLVSATYTARAVRPAASELAWEQAGSAAESGLADYTRRMRADPAYWEQVDCDNVALVGQPVAMVAHTCSWTDGEVGWAAVEAGEDPATAAAYHYELSQVAVEQGDQATSITLMVTGRSGGTYRTLQARLTRTSSADYLLSADYWLIDPAVWKEYSTGTLDAQCGGSTAELTRYYQDRTVTCANDGIYLGTGESLTGDVLINDAAYIAGGVVDGRYSTAHAACEQATSDPLSWTRYCLRSSTAYSGTLTFSGIQPTYTTPRTLPDGTGSFATLPGCRYYGATRIVLLGDGGQMQVWSRDTAAAVAAGAPTAVADASGQSPDCGDPALLASAAGARVAVPDGMVVYVANVPDEAGVPAEPIAAKAIGGSAQYGYLPIGGYTGAAPASASATTTIDPDMMLQRKYRTIGNLYLEGSLDGFVTFAAEGSVVLTGDVVLAGGMSGDDMAGIVAGHSVEIYRPVTRTLTATTSGGSRVWAFSAQTTTSTALTWAATTTSGTTGSWPHRYRDADRGTFYPATGLQVQASVQALTHSIYVQQYWTTGAGANANRQLVVQGSIATRYVGLTTSGNYGYRENHSYDPRLAFQTPPYLSRFEESEWETGVVGEISTPDAVRG